MSGRIPRISGVLEYHFTPSKDAEHATSGDRCDGKANY